MAQYSIGPAKRLGGEQSGAIGQGVGGIWQDTAGFQRQIEDQKVSMADLIVLGGSAAVEKAAKNAGFSIEVSFTAGRTDATQSRPDVASKGKPSRWPMASKSPKSAIYRP